MTNLNLPKTIPDFPDYAITKDGRVWSRLRKNTKGERCGDKWLKPYVGQSGHLQVCLWRGGKSYSVGIHHLLLETFVGPHPQGMQCRHLNGNPADNRLGNLAWGTAKENAKDRELHGNTFHPRGEKQGQSKLTEQDVRMIIYMYRTGLFLQREIAKIHKVTGATVSRILNRKRWCHLWAN